MKTITDSDTQQAERNWGAEAWRAPDLLDGDTLIYDECGRVMDKTDYRSHYFRLVKDSFGSCYLLVKHGAGQERISTGWSKRIIPSLADLDSDSRYFMLHTLHKMYGYGAQQARTATEHQYRTAFVDGRLKKRKVRGQSAVKVWITPAKTTL